MSTKFRLTSLASAAGFGLLLASAAAPIALADPPGYYFKDFPSPSAIASSRAAGAATDAQIAAINRKADQALETARLALREAQQAFATRESTPGIGTSARERLRPVVDGRHVQPRPDDICGLSHRSLDCRTANAADDHLFREILGRATP
jgi:hypothetical protein